MDHIWGAAEIWRNHVRSIEMSAFQEALISRGLKEHPEEGDAVMHPAFFTSILLLYPLLQDVKTICKHTRTRARRTSL